MTESAASAAGASKARRFDRWRCDNRNENSLAGAQPCPVRPSGKPRDGKDTGAVAPGFLPSHAP